MTRAISPLVTVVTCTIKSTSRGRYTKLRPASVVILCFHLCAQFTSPICVGVGSFPSALSCRTTKGIDRLVVTSRMTNIVTWTHTLQEETFAQSSGSRCHLWYLHNTLLSRRHQPATPSVQLGLNILKSATHPERQDSLERFQCFPDVRRCQAQLFSMVQVRSDLRYGVRSIKALPSNSSPAPGTMMARSFGAVIVSGVLVADDIVALITGMYVWS